MLGRSLAGHSACSSCIVISPFRHHCCSPALFCFGHGGVIPINPPLISLSRPCLHRNIQRKEVPRSKLPMPQSLKDCACLPSGDHPQLRSYGNTSSPSQWDSGMLYYFHKAKLLRTSCKWRSRITHGSRPRRNSNFFRDYYSQSSARPSNQRGKMRNQNQPTERIRPSDLIGRRAGS